MEKRSGFWKFGEVLGHVPTAPSNARKHEKSLFQGGDFLVESRRENCLEINPWIWSKKRVGKNGFRKEDDEKMSRLTNRVPV